MEVPRFLSEIFPQDQTDLSWVPDGVDPNSSYRLAVRVGAYVKLTDDGNRVYCDAYNIPKVLDRDRTNWKDLVVDIATEINLGPNNKLRVTYWDKINRSYEEISSDQKLIDAIDMYWEIRRLSLQVCVMKKDDSDSVHEIRRKQNMPCVLQGSTETSDAQIIAVPSSETAPSLLEPLVQESVEVAWVDDDVEYVGLDDEDPFKTLLSDSECDGLDDVLECVDLEDDVECVGLDDELVVDDALGCETFIHATDLENPTIAVGVTFGDGDTFKKAIRQYAIMGEFEIAAPYSESTRYRGYCKAERCKWRIHASWLQDERTWKVLQKFD